MISVSMYGFPEDEAAPVLEFVIPDDTEILPGPYTRLRVDHDFSWYPTKNQLVTLNERLTTYLAEYGDKLVDRKVSDDNRADSL